MRDEEEECQGLAPRIDVRKVSTTLEVENQGKITGKKRKGNQRHYNTMFAHMKGESRQCVMSGGGIERGRRIAKWEGEKGTNQSLCPSEGEGQRGGGNWPDWFEGKDTAETVRNEAKKSNGNKVTNFHSGRKEIEQSAIATPQKSHVGERGGKNGSLAEPRQGR